MKNTFEHWINLASSKALEHNKQMLRTSNDELATELLDKISNRIEKLKDPEVEAARKQAVANEGTPGYSNEGLESLINKSNNRASPSKIPESITGPARNIARSMDIGGKDGGSQRILRRHLYSLTQDGGKTLYDNQKFHDDITSVKHPNNPLNTIFHQQLLGVLNPEIPEELDRKQMVIDSILLRQNPEVIRVFDGTSPDTRKNFEKNFDFLVALEESDGRPFNATTIAQAAEKIPPHDRNVLINLALNRGASPEVEELIPYLKSNTLPKLRGTTTSTLIENYNSNKQLRSWQDLLSQSPATKLQETQFPSSQTTDLLSQSSTHPYDSSRAINSPSNQTSIATKAVGAAALLGAAYIAKNLSKRSHRKKVEQDDIEKGSGRS